MSDELVRKKDVLDALMAEREHLLANGQKGAEHILTHHGYNVIDELPPVQPFYNITMNDVLKYIDGMPEDVWQEFTACLECRGWELQRRAAKWCGSEFA